MKTKQTHNRKHFKFDPLIEWLENGFKEISRSIKLQTRKIVKILKMHKQNKIKKTFCWLQHEAKRKIIFVTLIKRGSFPTYDNKKCFAMISSKTLSRVLDCCQRMMKAWKAWHLIWWCWISLQINYDIQQKYFVISAAIIMKLKHLNCRQISALIRKDVLVRLRQPVSWTRNRFHYLASHAFDLSSVDDISSVLLAVRNISLVIHSKIKISTARNRQLSISHAPTSI